MAQALLSDAIDDFLLFRQSQDYSKRTLANLRVTLRGFLTSVGNIYLHNVSERHVTNYFADATTKRVAASLRNDHAALSTFFEWARMTRRMPADHHPMAGRRRPKSVEKERNRLHVSRFGALLDAAGDDDPRNRAMVAILLYLLLRDREMADLRIKDVDLDAGYVMVRVFKTGLEDRMPISTELDAELRTWLRVYTEKVGPLSPLHYLIPRRMPTPIAREGGRIFRVSFDYFPDKPTGPCGDTVKRALERIGFPIVDAAGETLREGGHTLRRSGARALFDQACANGYDGALRLTQSMLHHKSVLQTERYIGITADRRTRDDIIRGHTMYRGVSGDKVVRLAR